MGEGNPVLLVCYKGRVLRIRLINTKWQIMFINFVFPPRCRDV